MGGHAQQYATGAVIRLRKRYAHTKAAGSIAPLTANSSQMSHGRLSRNSSGQWVHAFNSDGLPKLIKYESSPEKPYQGAYVSAMHPTEQPRDTTVICEGAKRGGAVATIGYTAIPLPGVDMAAATGTDELIPAIDGLPRDADIRDRLRLRRSTGNSRRRGSLYEQTYPVAKSSRL